MGVLVALCYPYVPIPLCPFKLFTTLPCPGCGGIRAANALLHGHVLEALYINPLSCILIVYIALLPFVYLYDKLTCHTIIQSLFFQPWKRGYTIVTITLLVCNWFWNIIKQL